MKEKKKIRCTTCGESNPAEIHTCAPGLYFSKHEKLKAICDDIKHILPENFYYDEDQNIFLKSSPGSIGLDVDVTEIIFTQPFIDRFIEYGLEGSTYDGYEAVKEICFYLKDPVDYLYNLLEIGKK